MTSKGPIDACAQCGQKLGEPGIDEQRNLSVRGQYLCAVCHRQLAHPLSPVLADDLEGLIGRYGIKRVVEALVSIAHEKALHLQVNWQDEPAARSWKRDAGRLGRVEDKLEN